jgi:hypothetical protein
VSRLCCSFLDRRRSLASDCALRGDQRDQVRRRLLAELRSRSITTVRTDVIFGTAKRPG